MIAPAPLATREDIAELPKLGILATEIYPHFVEPALGTFEPDGLAGISCSR
jgi:hypothetical protein